MTLEEMEEDIKAFFEELAQEPRPGDVRETTLEELGLEKDQVFMYRAHGSVGGESQSKQIIKSSINGRM